MKWIKNHSYLGMEFDWVCVDCNLNVGYFSTAGYGPIPEQVMFMGDLMRNLTDSVDELPQILDESEVGIFLDNEELVSIARKGFFVFDWNHFHNLYTIAARPIVENRVVVIAEHLFLDSVRTCVLSASFEQENTLNPGRYGLE